MSILETAEETDPRSRRRSLAAPGVLVISCSGAPCSVALPVGASQLALGRDDLAALGLSDTRMSREHALFRLRRGQIEVSDAGSRNGTFVRGTQIDRGRWTALAAADVVRVGQTLLLASEDVTPYQEHPVGLRGGVVVGPEFGADLEQIEAYAKRGSSLLILGESGTGKEICAKHFHASGRGAKGPFIAVNCSTIPPSLAERLLFGARAGAYSGADTNTQGFLEAAHGGTLFLDEVGELEPTVQAKLLRVLETREVLPLGATQPRKVDFQFCAATLRDLRQQVGSSAFRADLFYRLGRAQVQLPGLRERLAELPWHVAAELANAGFKGPVHSGFLEVCLSRPWPGNVRELRGAIESAALRCEVAGHDELMAEDLPAGAGVEVVTSSSAPSELPSDERIIEALERSQNNVSAAARELGIHRTQLRRWLQRREG